jgi:hypothetical protein
MSTLSDIFQSFTSFPSPSGESTMRHAKLLALAAALLAAACSETPTAHQSAPPAASFDKGGNTMGSGNVVSGSTTEAQDGIFAGSGNYTGGTSSDSTTADGSQRGTGALGSGG